MLIGAGMGAGRGGVGAAGRTTAPCGGALAGGGVPSGRRTPIAAPGAGPPPGRRTPMTGRASTGVFVCIAPAGGGDAIEVGTALTAPAPGEDALEAGCCGVGTAAPARGTGAHAGRWAGAGRRADCPAVSPNTSGDSSSGSSSTRGRAAEALCTGATGALCTGAAGVLCTGASGAAGAAFAVVVERGR